MRTHLAAPWPRSPTRTARSCVLLPFLSRVPTHPLMSAPQPPPPRQSHPPTSPSRQIQQAWPEGGLGPPSRTSIARAEPWQVLPRAVLPAEHRPCRGGRNPQPTHPSRPGPRRWTPIQPPRHAEPRGMRGGQGTPTTSSNPFLWVAGHLELSAPVPQQVRRLAASQERLAISGKLPFSAPFRLLHSVVRRTHHHFIHPETQWLHFFS